MYKKAMGNSSFHIFMANPCFPAHQEPRKGAGNTLGEEMSSKRVLRCLHMAAAPPQEWGFPASTGTWSQHPTLAM